MCISTDFCFCSHKCAMGKAGLAGYTDILNPKLLMGEALRAALAKLASLHHKAL